MKVSTSLSYQRSLTNIQDGQAQVAKTREQLSTGKVMVRPSDDPSKLAQIENLDRAVAKTESYGDLITHLKDRYQLEETVLRNGADILIRMKDLALQAANDSLSPADRDIIAVEAKGLRDELLSIANTRDVDGNTIFAGSNTEADAFVTNDTGSVVYQGDTRQTQVNVSDARQLSKNRNGLEIFYSPIRAQDDGQNQGIGFFNALDDFVAGLQGNDVGAINRSLSELDLMHESVAKAVGRIGSELQSAETQLEINQDSLLRLQTLRSGEEDLDYAEAVTRFNQEMTRLEATQATFSRVSQLSLFEYL